MIINLELCGARSNIERKNNMYTLLPVEKIDLMIKYRDSKFGRY